MPRHPIIALPAAILSLAAICPAQTPSTLAPATIEFAQEPFRVDSIGLIFLVPVGARAEQTRIGPQAATRITPEGDARWVIDVQTIRESPGSTVEDVIGKIAQSLLESVGIRDSKDRQINSTLGEVLQTETNLVLAGGAADRVYIAIPQGPDQPRMIRGYTVFANAPGTFVSFALFATEPEFVAARRAYEAIVATAEFKDPLHVSAEREAAVRTGTALLRRIDDATYRDTLKALNGQWQRHYRPASTGLDADADELGYRRMLCWLGRREDVERTEREAPKDSALAEGYVVRTEARLRGRDGVIDTVGTFFLSFDLNEEAWLIRLARRESGPGGEKVARYSETGARSRESMMVTVRGHGRAPEIFKPVIEGDGYLSQAQVFLLPHLLVKQGIEADYGFYCYQSAVMSIRLRRDTLEQTPDGLWKLTTKATEESTTAVSLYDADGELIRSDTGDGRLWEPITLERLAETWRKKGLPMD